MAKYDFDGSIIRPDILIHWTMRANVKEFISSADGKLKDVPLHWYNAESHIECKKRIGIGVPNAKAMSCVHILPRILPNVAGTPYITLGPSDIVLSWSDPSRVLHSHNHPPHEDKKLSKMHSVEFIVLRYVVTVMRPLPKLPARDSTMHMKSADGKPIWDIEYAGKSYNGCRKIFDLHEHSRQAFVFLVGRKERVIMDYLRNSKRDDSEGNILLKKTKGVPGVVQVNSSDDVKLDEDEFLKTSGTHSGENSEIMLQLEEGTRPCRIEHRYIRVFAGKSLRKREFVKEIFEAVHDSLEGEHCA